MANNTMLCSIKKVSLGQATLVSRARMYVWHIVSASLWLNPSNNELAGQVGMHNVDLLLVWA